MENQLDMSSNEQATNSVGVTIFKGKEFTFTWSIHNFELHHFDDEYLDSPQFPTNAGDDLLWTLQIHTNEANNDYLSIALSSYSQVKLTKKVHLTLSIVDCNSKKHVLARSAFHTDGRPYEGREFAEFLKNDFLYNEKHGFLLNGILTIHCKMFFVDEITEELQSKSLGTSNSCDCNLKSLLETKKLSDVILKAGIEKFEAHKYILSAQSKVFSAMFKHDMKEKNSNLVEIDDIKPSVIQEMLQFIYCGKTDGFQDAANLFIAADKYEIKELKSACIDQMISDINIKNAFQTLLLAHHYKLAQLKTHAMQFNLDHYKEIGIHPSYLVFLV